MANKKQQSLSEPTLRTSTSMRSGCAKSDMSLGLLAAIADSVVADPGGRCMWYGDERRWYTEDVVSRSDTLLCIHNNKQRQMHLVRAPDSDELQVLTTTTTSFSFHLNFSAVTRVYARSLEQHLWDFQGNAFY